MERKWKCEVHRSFTGCFYSFMRGGLFDEGRDEEEDEVVVVGSISLYFSFYFCRLYYIIIS